MELSQVAREGVDGKLWRVLRDLASNPPQVSEQGTCQKLSLGSAGVTQGVICTLLFDIFIDDLVAELHDTLL
jgi:hypothetical protein